MLDDDMDCLRLFATVLRHFGHDVTATEDAEHALQAYQIAKQDGGEYDLLICDLAMPYMNGIETVAKIRDAGDWETRVAFLTGHSISALATDGMMERIDALRPVGVWSKPIRPEILAGNVADVLSNGEQ